MVGIVAFVVDSALAFTLIFSESPLSKLLPEPTPFALEATTVTTRVDQLLSTPQQTQTPLLVTATSMTDTTTATKATEYTHGGH